LLELWWLGKVMAVTVVLLVVAVGAIFFLLACLRGFIRAGNDEKTQGLLVRAQSAGDGEDVRTIQSLELPLQPKGISETTRRPEHISKNTLALVGLVILLGSRSTSFAIPMSALAIPHSKGKVPAQEDLFLGKRLRHHP
jgi:hypothetical protein